MSDSIDIVIRDRIEKGIRQKIINIGRAADVTANKLKELKAVMNLKGSGISFPTAKIDSAGVALEKLKQSYNSTAASAARSFQAQENAINSAIASEERALKAANARATAEKTNAQKLQQETTKTAKAIQLANGQVKRSHDATFRAQQKTRTEAVLSNQKIQQAIKKTASYSSKLAAQQKTDASKIVVAQQKAARAFQTTATAAAISAAKIRKAQADAAAAVTRNATARANQPNAIGISQANLAKAQSNAAAAATRASAATARLVALQRRLAESANRAAMANRRLGLSLNMQGLNRSILTGVQSLKRLERSAYQTAQVFRSVLSGALLLGAASALVDKVDAPRRVENQLRQAAKVSDEFGNFVPDESLDRLNELKRRIYEVASEARAPVTELTTTFYRLDLAMETVGKSQEETLRITETIAKALALTGSNATEAGQAMRQLSQAFSKGKLDGDEFRTTAETMPLLSKALETALGSSRKELFKLSETGKISIEVMIEAFQTLAKQVDEDFARTPRTIGQAFTQLGNNISLAFGQMDASLGFTDRMNSWIDAVKNNMPTVLKLLRSLAAAFVVLGAAQFFASFGTFITVLASAPVLLATVVGYFTYFSAGLKVAGTDGASLTDTMRVLKDELLAIVSGTSLGDFFTLKGAQANLDLIINKMESLGSAVVSVYIGMKVLTELFNSFASGEGIFSAESLKSVGRLLVKYTWNAIVGLATDMAKKFTEVANEIGFSLVKMFGEVFVFVAKAIDDTFGFGLTDFEGSIQDGLNQALKSFENAQLKPEEFDEASLKFLADTTEEVKQLGDAWNTHLDNVAGPMIKLQEEYRIYTDSLREAINAEKEMRLEREAAAKTNGPNPNALRGAGGGGSAYQFPSVSPEEGRIMDQSSQGARMLFDYQSVSQTVEQIKLYRSELELLRQSATTPIGPEDVVSSINKKAKAGQELFNQMREGASNIGEGLNKAKQSTEEFGQTTTQSLQGLGQNMDQTAGQLGSSFQSGASAAQGAAQQMGQGILSILRQITDAAHDAAQAMSGIGFGGVGIAAGGFSAGGYTGSGGRRQVAGVVHGQEYVMPAAATKRYRPLLEAMRSGRTLPSNTVGSKNAGPGVNITVENHGSSNISVQQMSATDFRIIAREEAQNAVSRGTDKAVARSLGNPNSRTAKTLVRNTSTKVVR